MITFKKTQMRCVRCVRANVHGGKYIIEAVYKGQEISVPINDSEIFDWLEDDSNKAKHQEAKSAAYMKVREAYELRKQYK